MALGGAPDHRLGEALQAYVALLEDFLPSIRGVGATGAASDPIRRTCVTTSVVASSLNSGSNGRGVTFLPNSLHMHSRFATPKSASRHAAWVCPAASKSSFSADRSAEVDAVPFAACPAFSPCILPRLAVSPLPAFCGSICPPSPWPQCAIATHSPAHQQLAHPCHAKPQLDRCLLLGYMALLHCAQNLGRVPLLCRQSSLSFRSRC
jgi:hypothetical protein